MLVKSCRVAICKIWAQAVSLSLNGEFFYFPWEACAVKREAKGGTWGWEFTQAMVLEQAVTAPVTGKLILDWLYAHEQVLLFNSSWELREHFLGDILEIRCCINVRQHWLTELAWHAAIEADIEADLAITDARSDSS